jgi:nucleoporin POM152
MDIGVNAVFEFTGTPPFRVHWTEQRKGSRLVEQSRKFDAHHGEVILQPENEGQYTYVSTPRFIWVKAYSRLSMP